MPLGLQTNFLDLIDQAVSALDTACSSPAFASEAIPLIRELIDRVDLRHTPDGWEVVLHGQLAALFNVALSDKKQAHPVTDEPCFIGSTKVVAGAGFEPAAFRL